MISSINSSLSALHSFSKKQESIADNTANVNTNDFKKTRVTFQANEQNAVSPQITRVETPGPLVYEQTSKGSELVEKSNVEISEEIPQAMVNKRAYQANVKMVQVADELIGSLLDIKG
ncbi:MAG: flagellar biosynthesis protein FlgC [Desulfobulbaceae bacterium]|nr:flagellar biosynthesis protein FlgC [Desulfobulbaceae bacterium]